jgi:Secretion system C-terminal sorting domain
MGVKKMKNLYLFVFLLTMIGSVSYSGTTTPTSVQSGNWNSTATWTGGAIPGLGDNVVIAHSVTVSDARSAKDVTINSGGTLILSADLSVYGDFSNQGIYTPNSYTLIFAGSAAQTIGGDQVTQFDNLTINNSSGVTLTENITVNLSLSFAAGKLFTTVDYMVTLTATGVLLESAGKNVEGAVAISDVVGKTSRSNWGGMGATFSAGEDDLGTVSLVRYTGAHGVMNKNSKSGIACTWKFNIANPVPNGRMLTFVWISDYDNGKTLTAARVWGSPTGGATWYDLSGSNKDASSRSISAGYAYGGSGFGLFTVSDNTNPLPVELVSFAAIVNGPSVTLDWRTATETNNYGFDIERKSTSSWSKVGFVEGHGTTNAPQSYRYSDNTVSGKIVYRLKQIDRDGKFEYSKEVEVTATAAPTVFALSQNYPNPFNPTTVIGYSIASASHVSLKVFDMLGREIATLVNGQMAPGNYTAAFDASRLSSGVYFYRLDAGTFSDVKRLSVMK